jgi:hypothetical protein
MDFGEKGNRVLSSWSTSIGGSHSACAPSGVGSLNSARSRGFYDGGELDGRRLARVLGIKGQHVEDEAARLPGLNVTKRSKHCKDLQRL